MKKVIFGSAMLISGVIGIVGTMIALVMGFDIPFPLQFPFTNTGLTLPMLAFAVMALTGLCIGILGLFTKERKK